MMNEAILSNEKNYTKFQFGNHVIRNSLCSTIFFRILYRSKRME